MWQAPGTRTWTHRSASVAPGRHSRGIRADRQSTTTPWPADAVQGPPRRRAPRWRERPTPGRVDAHAEPVGGDPVGEAERPYIADTMATCGWRGGGRPCRGWRSRGPGRAHRCRPRRRRRWGRSEASVALHLGDEVGVDAEDGVGIGLGARRADRVDHRARWSAARGTTASRRRAGRPRGPGSLAPPTGGAGSARPHLGTDPRPACIGSAPWPSAGSSIAPERRTGRGRCRPSRRASPRSAREQAIDGPFPPRSSPRRPRPRPTRSAARARRDRRPVRHARPAGLDGPRPGALPRAATATVYRVRYAIADVPAFVRPGGAVDEEARRARPDRLLPRHPHPAAPDRAERRGRRACFRTRSVPPSSGTSARRRGELHLRRPSTARWCAASGARLRRGAAGGRRRDRRRAA